MRLTESEGSKASTHAMAEAHDFELEGGIKSEKKGASSASVKHEAGGGGEGGSIFAMPDGGGAGGAGGAAGAGGGSSTGVPGGIRKRKGLSLKDYKKKTAA